MGLIESLFEDHPKPPAAQPQWAPFQSAPAVQLRPHTYRPEPLHPQTQHYALEMKRAAEQPGGLSPLRPSSLYGNSQPHEPPLAEPVKRQRVEQPQPPTPPEPAIVSFLTEEARAWDERRPHDDYGAADAHALACPAHEERSLDSLAAYLCAPFPSSDRLKARALFRWTADRIAYSETYLRERLRTGAPPSAEDNTPEAVLRTRVAVCAGYAYLLEALCRRAGLAARYVSGHDGKTDHAWVAVRLEGRWALLDPTWAAGHTDLKAASFTPHFEPFWFDTPAALFVLRHRPAQERDQLLENVRPAFYLAEHARPEPLFYGMGLRLEPRCWRRRWGAPRGDLALSLLAAGPRDARELRVELAFKDGPGRERRAVPAEGLVSIRREEAGRGLTRHVLRLRFPYPGRYKVTVMALAESRPGEARGTGTGGGRKPTAEQRLFKGVVTFKVEAGSGLGPGPHFPDSFALGSARALERCSIELVERQSDGALLRAERPLVRLPFLLADPAAEVYPRLSEAPVPPGFVGTAPPGELGGGRRLLTLELAFPRPGTYVAQVVTRLRGEKEWQYAAGYLIEAQEGTSGAPAFPTAYGGARPDIAHELGIRPASHPRGALIDVPPGGLRLAFALARPEVKTFVRVSRVEGDPLSGPLRPSDFDALPRLPSGFVRPGQGQGTAEFEIGVPGPGFFLAQLFAADPRTDGDRYRPAAGYLLRAAAAAPDAPLAPLPPFPETAAGGDAEACRALGLAPLSPPGAHLALAPGELRARLEVAASDPAVRLALRLSRLPEGFASPPAPSSSSHDWFASLPELPAAHAADLGRSSSSSSSSSSSRHAFALSLPGPGLYLAQVLALRGAPHRSARWSYTLAYFVSAPASHSSRSLRAAVPGPPRAASASAASRPAFPQSFALGSADVCRELAIEPVPPADAAHVLAPSSSAPVALRFACGRPDVELALQVRSLGPAQAADPLALDGPALAACPELPPGFVRDWREEEDDERGNVRFTFEVAFPQAPGLFVAQLLARAASDRAGEWRYALGYLLEAREGADAAAAPRGGPVFPESFAGASTEACRRFGVAAASHRAALVELGRGGGRELRLRAALSDPSRTETFLRVRRWEGGAAGREAEGDRALGEAGAGLQREAGPGGFDVAFPRPGPYLVQLLAAERDEAAGAGPRRDCFVALSYLVEVPPEAATGGLPRYPSTTAAASDAACRQCGVAPESHHEAVLELGAADRDRDGPRPLLLSFLAAPGTAPFAQMRALPPSGPLPPPAALASLPPAPDGFLREAASAAPAPAGYVRHAFEICAPGPGRFLLQLLCRPPGAPEGAPFLHVLAYVLLACSGAPGPGPGPRPAPPAFPESYAGAGAGAARALGVRPAPGYESAFVRAPGPRVRLPLEAPTPPALRLHAVLRALPPASWAWAEGAPLPDPDGRVREAAAEAGHGARALEFSFARPGRYAVQVLAGPPAARTLSAVLGYCVEVGRGAGEGPGGLFPIEYRAGAGLALARPASRLVPTGSCPFFEVVVTDPARRPVGLAVSDSASRWFHLPQARLAPPRPPLEQRSARELNVTTQVGEGRYAGEAGPLVAGDVHVMARWEAAERSFHAAFGLLAE
eukprot:tig00000806_g4371.t1